MNEMEFLAILRMAGITELVLCLAKADFTVQYFSPGCLVIFPKVI